MFTQRQNILEEIEALKQRDLQLRRQQEIDSRLYLLLSTLIIIIIIIIHRQCLWCSPRDHGHCKSSPSSFDESRLIAGLPPTLRPSQPTWAVSPPINDCCHPHRWRSGAMGMALDLRSIGRGFKSYSRQRYVTTKLGKLFTPICLCHQAV